MNKSIKVEPKYQSASMLECLDERKISSKRRVEVRKFPGATAEDMYHYLKQLLQKQRDNVILHRGC